MTRSSGVPGPPPCPSSSPPSLSGHQPQDGTAVSSLTFARSVAHDSGQVGSLTLHMIPNGQSSPGGVRALRRTVAGCDSVPYQHYSIRWLATGSTPHAGEAPSLRLPGAGASWARKGNGDGGRT